MKFTNATNINRKSGVAQWRDLRVLLRRSLCNSKFQSRRSTKLLATPGFPKYQSLLTTKLDQRPLSAINKRLLTGVHPFHYRP
jgi:hypothetical protein